MVTELVVDQLHTVGDSISAWRLDAQWALAQRGVAAHQVNAELCQQAIAVQRTAQPGDALAQQFLAEAQYDSIMFVQRCTRTGPPRCTESRTSSGALTSCRPAPLTARTTWKLSTREWRIRPISGRRTLGHAKGAQQRSSSWIAGNPDRSLQTARAFSCTA
jgi:hypothetical protein